MKIQINYNPNYKYCKYSNYPILSLTNDAVEDLEIITLCGNWFDTIYLV